MSLILHPLFALLASATRQELAGQVAYLKEENRILGSRLPAQISVTAKERQRLLRVGRKLGAQLKELISIVTYGSFLRWIREAAGQTATEGASTRKPEDPCRHALAVRFYH